MTWSNAGPRADGRCDWCGTTGPRQLVEQADGPLDGCPSRWLLCCRCTGTLDLPDGSDVEPASGPAVVLHPLTGRALVTASATLAGGGRVCGEDVISRVAETLVPGDQEQRELAAHATALVCLRLDVDDLAEWCAYPARTRADVVAILRATGEEYLAAHPCLEPYAPSAGGDGATDRTDQALREHIGAVEVGLFALADRFDQYGSRMDATLNRFADLLASRVHELDTRIDAADARAEAILSRLQLLEQRVASGAIGPVGDQTCDRGVR